MRLLKTRLSKIVFFLTILSILITKGNAQVGSFNSVVKVVRIIDGDTFVVSEKDSLYKVRLFGIDAPEYGQEFYNESKLLLKELTLNNKVLISIKGRDVYGRVIANIERVNDSLNINYEMVKKGLAWHFLRYSADPILARLEFNAREKQIGIWSIYHFVEPWVYRKNK